MSKYLCLILLFANPFATIIAQENKHTTQLITGRIFDASTKKALPFATIYAPELEIGAIAGVDGSYSILLPLGRNTKLVFNYLGYNQATLILEHEIYKKGPINIPLSPLSFELDNIIIKAEYSKDIGFNAKISQEALEYIHPTSLSDVFLLTPGGTIQTNNIHSRSLLSSRQAGVDKSTSLGMGLSIDGVPVHNDGLRVQMAGYTGVASIDPSNNVAVNTGIDLRTISTDHIDNVTISQGIASAKEGNLSSGLIKITSKKGKSPIQLRTKLDPLNKLIYIGKGFLLSEKMGTLHAGVDVTKSANDLRNKKSSYNRITSQLNYNNQFHINEKKIDLNLKGSFISSFNDTKNDEKINARNENYKTNYERYSFSSKVLADLNYPVIDKLEFLASLDYSKDILEHKKRVHNMTVMAIQSSRTEGEHEGEYLPQSYDTRYKIENKPLNGFASINAKKYGKLSDNFNYNILLGTAFSYSKNMGRGAILNPLRPPFPDNSYIRARPNNKIPALANNAWYVEGKFRYKKQQNEINSSIGLRSTRMFNLPSNYKLNGLLLNEPRLQFSYTLRNKINQHELINTLRLGYGIENKLPTIDYLYPDKIYQDFIVLNAYFTDPKKRLLITQTKIYNPENQEIRENKNTKIEFGWETSFRNYNLSLSLFRETMDGGLEYFSEYIPISYTYYNELKHPVNGKPTKDDYNSYLRRDFMHKKHPVNSAKIVKKGVEYRLNFPKLNSIKSEIEINGAYYKTLYTSGVPVMFRPSITLDNKPYSFVGIYDGFNKRYRERFNTNIWVHTHLPKFKLIFTNFFQFIWIDTNLLGKDVASYPYSYLDLDGNINKISPDQIEKTPYLGSLKRRFPPSIYNKARKPISMIMNLKLTKEFNHSIRLSFFANNLLQISPSYKSKQLRTLRDWHSPFFGTELIIKL